METVEFVRCEKCQKIWAVGNSNHKCKTKEVMSKRGLIMESTSLEVKTAIAEANGESESKYFKSVESKIVG